MRPSDEQLFVAFQRRRDVGALSELFHRRVGELLRLAVFLAPCPNDADDLVQATFLSAIARAESYDRRHRVMSWLCGILTNHARMLRRSARRLHRAGGAAATAAGEDPAAASARAEAAQALARGIAALREPYRSVLQLHLHDGLSNAEISTRLARPAATVRKQMERGLRQLRTALPSGLALALVARLDAAATATRAAEAARFVDPPTLPGNPPARHPIAPHRTTRPLLWSAAAAALVAGAVVAFEPLAAGTPAPRAVLATGTAPAAPATSNGGSGRAAAVGRRSPAAATGARRLLVVATDPDGAPHADLEVLCVADDGQSLPLRLAAGAHRARTDAAGRAWFELPPARYEVTLGGSLSRNVADLTAGDREVALRQPRRQPLAGRVVAADGRPVAGAMVFASESAGRGDLGWAVAISAADGRFAGSTVLASGRLYARHPAFGQSPCLRLEAGHDHELQLEAADRVVTVRVRDPGGQPASGCQVALIPKSSGTSLYAPLLAATDEHGECRLPGPGPRPATILAVPAARHGLAAAAVDLTGAEACIEIALDQGAHLTGVARNADGTPLAGRVVVAALAALRTNEPVAPLSAHRTRTDASGRFEFASVPAGDLLVRIYSPSPAPHMPLAALAVAAGCEVTAAPGTHHHLEIVALPSTAITGALRDPRGAPLAGWHVLAVPAGGTAVHRMMRRRAAMTGADGSFLVAHTAVGETYQLGFYPPEHWWPHEQGWPLAVAVADSGLHCTVELDPAARPRTRLHCQALLPNGRPCPAAAFELRALAHTAPLSNAADAAGRVCFGPLPPGDYWLVLVAPGFGSRTIPVRIDPTGDDVDLGAIALEPPAQVRVRLWWPAGAGPQACTLLAGAVPGDKFTRVQAGPAGALLPPLPPGDALLRVHGPGIAPRALHRALFAGRQILDVDLEPASAVHLSFPFRPAENPFVVDGPLWVRVFDAEDALVIDDHIGTSSAPGRFELATGLRPGRYRVVARSIWDASAELTLVVADGPGPFAATAPLRLGAAPPTAGPELAPPIGGWTGSWR